jgi:uncharacterized membrane protein HdeD (DUF308 family)
MAKQEMVHCHPQCMGTKAFVLGVLILLNATYAFVSWAVFVGGALTLMGLIHMMMPACKCK